MILEADVWVDQAPGGLESQIGKPLSAEHPDVLCVSVELEEMAALPPAPGLYPSPTPFVPGTPPATIAELSAPKDKAALPVPGTQKGRWRLHYTNKTASSK